VTLSRRALVCTGVLLGAVSAAADARAQVNTETLRKRIKVVGYSLIVEGSLTADTGNTEGIAAGAGLGGGWAGGPHLLFAYGRFDYTKYADVESVNKSFAHARYDYEFLPWLWGEVFAQAQSDAFQRLDLRNLWGTGPRFRVLHVPAPSSLDVYLGTAYMLERDAITAVVGATGAQNQSIQVWHRWSSYASTTWEIDPRAVVSSTMYVQPAITDFGDVRLLNETLLTFKITKVFSAGLSASVRYDSEPPTGVLPTDTEVKNSLLLTY
jgi:putative salt-induced outer membrane protein YdiY